MTGLTINVVGTPAPQGSKRAFVVNGRAVMTESSKKVKPWRQDVVAATATAIAEHRTVTGMVADWTPLPGPLQIAVVFYIPRPAYHYGTGRNAGRLKDTAPAYVDKKPDVDKLLRSTLDGLTESGVFRDDAQVASLAVEKRYADAATGARIHIAPLTAVPAAPLSPAAGAAPTAPRRGRTVERVTPTEGLF